MAGETVGVLIVGAGQAGAMAAASLRSLGFKKRILMVGAEPLPPYERPPLSKTMLAGAGSAADVLVHPAGFHEENSIELLCGVEVASLDVEAHAARLSDGRSIEYGHCVIATGGSARTVAGLPPAHARVHYLRTMADALRLRGELGQQRSALVVGGGFLGLEVASTARAMGLAVTVVESAPRVLARAVPQEMSLWLQRRIAAAGVDLRLDTRCESFALHATGVTATLQSGAQLSADLVVVAVGLEPEVDLARRAGIPLHEINRGIRIDARCATAVPDVYAAGDCTSQLHPFIGSEVRLESWQNANEQARRVAAAIVDAPLEVPGAPWFWSDQFECNLQILGMPVAGLTYHCRGAMGEGLDAPGFVLLGADEAGRIVHALAINAGRDLRQLKSLVDSKTPCDPQALCDVALPLRQQVRTALERCAAPSIS